MKKIYWIGFVAISLFAMTTAIAATEPTVTAGSGVLGSVENSINNAVTSVVGKLSTLAILWLSSFVMIQFLITNLGLLKSGADLEAVWAKLLGSLLWFGFCFYVVLNGAEFVQKVGNSFFTTASGLGITFDAGALIDKGVTIGANVITTVQNAAGMTDFGSVIIAGLCGLFILVVMAFIALKVFLMKIELALVVMISPISFAFLGLNALKDQGIAPFKSLISLFYRIMILGVLIVCVEEITTDAMNSITSISIGAEEGWFSTPSGGIGIWPGLLNITVGYLIIGFLAFKSDSIAASLSSGSTSLGTSDVATAAAMGAAVGGALGATGAAAKASKPAQAMGDFMKKAFGGGGGVGVNNATPDVGSAGVGTPPSKTDSPSKSQSNAGGGSASSKTASGQNTGSKNGGGGSNKSLGANPNPDFPGVPNKLPEQVEAEKNKEERHAASKARRENTNSGSASSAGNADTGASLSHTDSSYMSQSDSWGGGATTKKSSGQNAASGNGVNGSNKPSDSSSALSSVPNETPGKVPSENIKSEQPTAREARVQEKASGSATTAGVAGGTGLEQQVGELVKVLGGQQGKKKGVMDHLSTLNQQIERERATVGASVNTHHD